MLHSLFRKAAADSAAARTHPIPMPVSPQVIAVPTGEAA